MACQRAGRAAALAPAQGWARGWQHPAALGVARAFLPLAPAAIPAGLFLASLLWGWRIYAISAGIGGKMASAPATFDARQWRRQVRAAEGRTASPGSVPLLARGSRIPVGGTIRAVACTWRPVFSLPRVHEAYSHHRRDRQRQPDTRDKRHGLLAVQIAGPADAGTRPGPGAERTRPWHQT